MQSRHIHLRSLALAAAALALALPAAAEGWRPAGYYVQVGIGDMSTWDASVGLTWPWAWKGSLLGIQVGGVTEAYGAHWDAPGADDGRRGFIQVGLVPVFRLRFAQGSSPWFAEAGVGISMMNRHFETPEKHFTTAFNFVDVLGIGRSFGNGQEIGVRAQHVSNAGIRSPNPGQNFLQLRYAAAF